LMMSLWDALRMNMMISYQELVRTFPSNNIQPVAPRITKNKIEYIYQSLKGKPVSIRKNPATNFRAIFRSSGN
ncbi:hypothetical protein OGX69_16590, partial [Citrobacter sp. Cb130]|uniref:hypothetical protein n=1 Tax=Citrobacter sp. Cb130 TaxID=2985033 RepID=UPI0025781031